jgi:hypothetical protein
MMRQKSKLIVWSDVKNKINMNAVRGMVTHERLFIERTW